MPSSPSPTSGISATAAPLYAQVVFNLPLDTVFTYLIDNPDLQNRAAIGKRVLAPFRNRTQNGYIVALEKKPPDLSPEIILQKLTTVVDAEPLFNTTQLKFYQRSANYYQTPLGEALFSLLPGGLQFRQLRVISLNEDIATPAGSRESPLLAELLNLLRAADGSLTLPEIATQIAEPIPLQRLKSRLSRWQKTGWIKIEDRLLPPPVTEQFELICEIIEKSEIINALAESRIAPEKRQRLIEFIEAGGFFSRRRFTGNFSGAAALIKRWQDKGWLKIAKIPKLRSLTNDDNAPLTALKEKVVLTPAQEKIFADIQPELEQQEFSPYLLHGVTGSGKTEIYIKLIAEVINRGAGAIYLVPEIALTIELVDRLIHEFGPQIAILHSGLSGGERYDQWRRIAASKARIVVGARSAIFAPLADLGLIIVDEEHEPSYKQDTGFAYNGRDLALLRGQMEKCGVVMGSATPSLISYYGARNGRYRLLSLPERLDQKPMPKVEIVDLGKEQKQMFAWDGFSPRLLERMTAVFARDRQVILFLNKRGFSRSLYCLNCGYMPDCRLCSVHMTFHKNLDLLVCHYCGGQQPLPTTCPKCGGQRFFPLGIGIQKLEEGLHKHFPEIKVLRLDRDATRRKGELGRIIEEFRSGQAQVLLGTQMLAKGHNFPGVDLVGVIFADLSLEMPEFTAPERTFQLLAQVAGRAGRGRDDTAGEVIVQTLQPDHYSVLTATAHDYEAFYEQEIQNRGELLFPPFSYLANLRASGPDQEQVRNFLNQAKMVGQQILGQNQPKPTFAPLNNADNSDNSELSEPDFSLPPIALLGPVPSAIVKIQNRYRWSLLLKAQNRPELHRFIRQWRKLLPTPATLKWRLDIDPQSFF